ncbi:MAG: putative lipid II flippase FtsW [Actinomycetota bacterium]|nr:putative lipid II flippase FtsW [Actinomycetota bacterium]
MHDESKDLSEERDSGWLLLCAVVALLCGIGLMMVLSASSVQALRSYGGAWVFFERQAMWVGIGVVALAVAARIDYRRWRRFGGPLVVFSIVLLILVLIPGMGISVSGSSRWLGVGQWRFQPAEFAKVAVLLFAADVLARQFERTKPRPLVLRPVLLATGALSVLVLLQPDMGTTIILVCVVLVVLFVGGASLRSMGALLLLSAVGGVVIGLLESYRRARLLSFLHPWDDVGNTGYQVAQSLVALGSGRVTGVGLGASRAKWGFLPNAHTDFIFAIIGEEMGLLGALVVVALFVVFAFAGVRAALRAPDRFGMLVASGVTAWVVVQALINIGAVSAIMPVTGVPLPFVSFGGSSLVITMGAVGLLVNVARAGSRKRPPGPERIAEPATRNQNEHRARQPSLAGARRAR